MARILIVDDSSFQRGMVKRMLQEVHEITEAPGGAEALVILRDQAFDCIICDLLMPDVSGFDVLSTLQIRKNTIPVIVLTADIQDTISAKCIELGAKIVLNKPPNKEILLQKVSEVIQ